VLTTKTKKPGGRGRKKRLTKKQGKTKHRTAGKLHQTLKSSPVGTGNQVCKKKKSRKKDLRFFMQNYGRHNGQQKSHKKSKRLGDILLKGVRRENKEKEKHTKGTAKKT